MTRSLMQAADELCNGRLVMAHEGGYCEVHVPFCGHAVLQEMSGSAVDAEDALGTRISGQQPSPAMQAVYRGIIDGFAESLVSSPQNIDF